MKTFAPYRQIAEPWRNTQPRLDVPLHPEFLSCQPVPASLSRWGRDSSRLGPLHMGTVMSRPNSSPLRRQPPQSRQKYPQQALLLHQL